MAKARRRERVKLLGFVRHGRTALMMGTALQATVSLVLAFPVHAQPAPNARPTGGVVVGGVASISQAANNTAINQSSQRAAVNWQSFNVGSQQSVTFNQPSAQSVTLNRVVGSNPSQIAGRIDANGQVVLVNQSGVTFYKGAQVNTTGLMVSAIGMTNQSVQNFVNGGQLVLDQPGNPNAAVINNGNITVRQAGLAALVAPQVANNGTITATLGHVVLAGAKTATLDLYGDGLLSLDVNNQVTQTPVGKDGKPVTALVTNTGVIIADGGTVQLTARAADGIVQNLVQAGGKIRAATMGDQTGTIALNGVGGSIIVEGQLSAVGAAPGTKGGAIEVVTNGNVGIASTARINASGKAGGGTVAVGTTLARAKGGPSVTATQTAKNVTVAKGATIAVNATSPGDGGRVTVLSTGTTVMNGTITATGGATSGNGGFVETSGQMLGVGTSALIDVAAPAPTGIAGTWLLDPFDVAITGADSNTSQTGTTFTGSADPATIANTTLQTALAGGNVIISTTGSGKIDQGNITVSSTVTWTSANSLTLAADNNILINAAISASNGGLVLNAGTSTATGSITISAPVAAQSFSASTGVSGTINLDFNTSPVVTTSGGGQTYSNPVVLQANASVADSANGAIKFASTVDGTTAGAQGLTVGAGTGAVTFGAAVGGAQSLANLTVTGPTTLSGNITTTGTQTFNNAVTLAADATIATTNSAVDFAGTVDDTTAGGQALTVNAGTGAVTFGAVVGGTKSLASLTVTGPTTLTGSLTTTGPQTFDNAVTLAASTALTTTNAAIQLLGQVTGGAHSLLLSTGTGNQTLSGVTTSGNLALITTGIVTLDGGTYSITGGASPFVFPAITTNGALTLGQATSFGAVTLGSDTKFDSSAVNGAIDFTSTVDDTTAGGQSLTVNAGTGAVTFGAPVGGTKSLASLTVTSPTTLTGNITTTGTQTFDNAVTLAATSTLATTNSAVDFAGTVDAAAAGAQGLTVSAGTGAVTFGAAVGGAQSLANLTVTGPTTLAGNITTTGTQTFNSAVTLAADSTLATTNSAIDFASTVDATTVGTQGLTVNAGTGTVTFGAAVGGGRALASLTASGATTLSGNITTTGTQTFNNAVTLAADATIATTNSAVDFAGTVDDTTAGGQALTVNAGTGAVTFGAVVGGTKSLASLTVTGPTTLTGSLTTTGTQTFDNAVTLAASTALTTTNAAIQLLGQVTGGAHSLLLSTGTGNQTLSGVTTSGNLALITTGIVTLDGGTYSITGGASPFVFPAITTNGALTLGQATNFGAVTLGSDTKFDSSAVNGAVDFASTVDDTTAGGQTLTVSAGTGPVTFGAPVGGTNSLASLTVSGPTKLTGNITTTGTQTFDNAVTLAAPATLTTTNAAIQLLGQVTGGANSLSLSSGTGNQTLSGVTTSGNLALTTTGIVTLDGGTYSITGGAPPYVFPAVTTNGTLTLGQATNFGAVTLGSDTKFDSSAVDGAIDFTSTVDDTTAGGQALTVDAGTGAVTFGAPVGGGSKSLASLTVTGPTTLTGNITTTGTQTFDSAVTLAATSTLATTNGAVDFASTVDGTTAGGQALTVNAGTGPVKFGAPVGGTNSLASLTVTSPTTLTGNITTTGTQTFDNVVTLAAPTTLTTANAAIQLLGQVTGGAHSLLLSAGTGNQTLSGVTTSGNLALITTGIVTLDGGTYSITGGAPPYVFPAVTTNGTLMLGQATNFGAVTLGSDTKLDSTAVNAAVDFTSTVDGGFGLTVNVGSATLTFGSTVGGTNPLTTAIATGGSIVIGGAITAGALTLDFDGHRQRAGDRHDHLHRCTQPCLGRRHHRERRDHGNQPDWQCGRHGWLARQQPHRLGRQLRCHGSGQQLQPDRGHERGSVCLRPADGEPGCGVEHQWDGRHHRHGQHRSRAFAGCHGRQRRHPAQHGCSVERGRGRCRYHRRRWRERVRQRCDPWIDAAQQRGRYQHRHAGQRQHDQHCRAVHCHGRRLRPDR